MWKGGLQQRTGEPGVHRWVASSAGLLWGTGLPPWLCPWAAGLGFRACVTSDPPCPFPSLLSFRGPHTCVAPALTVLDLLTPAPSLPHYVSCCLSVWGVSLSCSSCQGRFCFIHMRCWGRTRASQLPGTRSTTEPQRQLAHRHILELTKSLCSLPGCSKGLLCLSRCF